MASRLFRAVLGCGVLALGSAVTVAAVDATSLVDAVRARDVEAVRRLLSQRQRVDVNAPEGDGATALHWAVHRDDAALVDLILRAGARANAVTDTGVTPLYLACTNRSAAIVEKLVTAGADPNASLISGETVLMECARTGDVRAVNLLLTHGADVNAREAAHHQTALMWAASNRHPEVVQSLLKAGADVRARSRTYEQTVTGGTNGSARSEDNSVVQRGGSTALLFAARVGDPESGRRLVAAGADVNEALPMGLTALVLAAHSGHAAMAAMLLEHGADPDDASAGYTAMHAAVLRGEATLVRSLLKYHANPNTRITRGTPLRRTSQDWELPAALAGATPYALAAKFLEVRIMRDLVAGGADPRIPLNSGTTPLMAAAGMGAAGQADRRGLAVLDGGKIPEAGQVAETVAVTLELGSDVNATNRDGDTALHFAASQGYDSIVQMLVDSGAQINAKNRQGQTPLGLLLRGRRGRGGANAFVNTYAQSSHPTTVELLRKLGAVE